MSRTQHMRQLARWRDTRVEEVKTLARRKKGGLPAAGRALRDATRQLLEAELRARRRAGPAQPAPQPSLFGGT